MNPGSPVRVPRKAASGGSPAGRRNGHRGFTLIELLLAIAISAVILVAANAVLFGAIRLRNRTGRLLEDASARQQALAILRRDISGMVVPKDTSAMIGAPMYGGMNGLNDPTGSGMQIYTSSGIVNDNARWGACQKVAYVLKDPTNNVASLGRDLWRVVTRNLLPQNSETYDEQLLLSDVDGFEMTFFDGVTWRPTWTGTNELVALPRAVTVNLIVAEAEPSERARGMLARRTLVPFQLVIPILVAPATNTVDSATDGGGQP